MNAYLAYYLLVVLASTGILQMISCSNGLDSLLFFRKRFFTRIISILFILPSFVAFFGGEEYFHSAPIQGAEQAALFGAAVITAIIVIFGVSSIINHKIIPPHKATTRGIQVLRTMTYFQAISRKVQ